MNNETELSPRTAKVNFMIREDTRVMLEKMSIIECRSMTGVVEQLIRKAAKEYGIICKE